ncbi:hypothetical protein [Streptomyces boninensis]|uniref:hypothetical protein n=1 Tax=Streptomyces boninensis TaxID=2039455 RepID=UPI003B20C8CE
MRQGASIEFRDLLATPVAGGHVTAMPAAMGDSSNFLADRFAGKQASGNCGKF